MEKRRSNPKNLTTLANETSQGNLEVPKKKTENE
jgi:hypothetical protein